MKHTPGPWRTANLDDLCPAEVEASDGHAVAMIREPYRSRQESEANARLIAAAPEMLEALEAMQAACNEWAAEFTQHTRAMDWGVVNDAYIKAAAAIRKAKGEQ